jgi:hypothetical protein
MIQKYSENKSKRNHGGVKNRNSGEEKKEANPRLFKQTANENDR